jgi:hypothetical protein
MKEKQIEQTNPLVDKDLQQQRAQAIVEGSSGEEEEEEEGEEGEEDNGVIGARDDRRSGWAPGETGDQDALSNNKDEDDGDDESGEGDQGDQDEDKGEDGPGNGDDEGNEGD